MRALIVPAALVVALVASVPAQAARGCHPRGTHTEAKDALVRVFSVKSGLFACRTGGGRRVTVQKANRTWESWLGVHVHGANVAFGRENCDEFSCYDSI